MFSLICVCYYFIEDGLPWTDYADLKMAKNPKINLYEVDTFKKLRIDLEEEFWDEFKNAQSPFDKIFTYLYLSLIHI